MPIIPELLPVIKEEIYFAWSGNIFCRILKSMGFRVRKSQLKSKMLIDRADIVGDKNALLK
jgi:hypothetical protein